jgi:DNA polymerase-3 subunit alpha
MKIKSIKIVRGKSQPDIDTDMSSYNGKSKDDVIKYLENKYHGNVAHVGNINFYSLKSAIRDLCTVKEIPAQYKFACTKEIDDNLTLSQNIQRSKTIRDFFKTYPELKDEVELLVGAVSATSVHAGGIIIGDAKYPLRRYCGLQRSENNSTMATIWTKDEVAQLGYVKYDLLGLSAAAKMHQIRILLGQDPYTDFEEIDDPEVFRNIAMTAKNVNVFQFESGLGKKALLELLPMNINELSNASGIIRVVKSAQGRALYESYKKAVEQVQSGDKDSWMIKLRKEVKNDYNFKCLAKILENTYGVLIYQEQLAQFVQYLSKGKKNFTDGNLFRKALDKFGDKHGRDVNAIQGDVEKLKAWHTDLMKLLKENILEYLEEDGLKSKDPVVQDFLNFNLDADNNLPVPTKGILGMIITAAAYIFSRLHSIAYSHTSYWFMYHKYYNPLEFWLSALIVDGGNSEDVVNYINAMRTESGLEILPPDINKSDAQFNIDKELEAIRFGLGSIKNLGDKALQSIISIRKKAPFKDFADFCKRVEARVINKRVIESLIFSGCFDGFNPNRFEVYDEYYALRKETPEVEFQRTKAVLSDKEREYLGLNIVYISAIQKKIADCVDMSDMEDDDFERQKVAVEIVKIHEKVTKNGKPYLMYSVRCLKSSSKHNIFCWNKQDLGKEGDMKILTVLRKNGFISY